MKRLLALTLSLVLTGGPAFAAPTPRPHHSHTSRASRTQPKLKLPVEVTFNAVGPKSLSDNSRLTVRARLTNQSQTSYQQVTARLLVGGTALNSRAELDSYMKGTGTGPTRRVQLRAVQRGLPQDGQADVALGAPVRKLGLVSGFGVYPVAVDVYSGAQWIGRQRTTVTYWPKGTDAKKTRLAWVWPLIDQPRRANDGTFTDDRLERELATGGRLGGLVSAVQKAPVSLLADPALIDDAAAMNNKDGYTIKGGAHRSRSVAAGGWLAGLRTMATGRQLISTPYADPDLNSLTNAGMATDITTSTQAGQRVMTRRELGLPATAADVALPPDGTVDRATLTGMVKRGARTVLLSSTALPDYGSQITTNPVKNLPVAGVKVKAVAYDATLNEVLGEDTHADGGAVQAEQRFLAETALITNERPHEPRTVVAMPPRRWDPDPAFAKRLLNQHVPWLGTVSLKNVLNTRPVNRTFQPPKSASGGLTRSYLHQVKNLSQQIGLFSSIFTRGESGFQLSPARLESSAWHGQSRHAVQLRGTVQSELNSAIGKVTVIRKPNNTANLAGKSARIPLTVSNELGSGTVKVRLNVSAENPARLRVGHYEREVTLEAGLKDTVLVPVQASANGIGIINVELLTADDKSFGQRKQMRIQATGYGRTALIIIGVSLVVLFLGVGYRVMRRRGDGAEEPGD